MGRREGPPGIKRRRNRAILRAVRLVMVVLGWCSRVMGVVLVGISLAVQMDQKQVGPKGLTEDVFVEDFPRWAVGDQPTVQAGGLVATPGYTGKVVGAEDYRSAFGAQSVDDVQ